MSKNVKVIAGIVALAGAGALGYYYWSSGVHEGGVDALRGLPADVDAAFALRPGDIFDGEDLEALEGKWSEAAEGDAKGLLSDVDEVVVGMRRDEGKPDAAECKKAADHVASLMAKAAGGDIDTADTKAKVMEECSAGKADVECMVAASSVMELMPCNRPGSRRPKMKVVAVISGGFDASAWAGKVAGLAKVEADGTDKWTKDGQQLRVLTKGRVGFGDPGLLDELAGIIAGKGKMLGDAEGFDALTGQIDDDAAFVALVPSIPDGDLPIAMKRASLSIDTDDGVTNKVWMDVDAEGATQISEQIKGIQMILTAASFLGDAGDALGKIPGLELPKEIEGVSPEELKKQVTAAQDLIKSLKVEALGGGHVITGHVDADIKPMLSLAIKSSLGAFEKYMRKAAEAKTLLDAAKDKMDKEAKKAERGTEPSDE